MLLRSQLRCYCVHFYYYGIYREFEIHFMSYESYPYQWIGFGNFDVFELIS